MFLNDPNEVIQCVSNILENHDTSNITSDLSQYTELFRSTRELVADYAQGQALQRLGAGVDIDRFLTDPAYKEGTVLGLAMTNDIEVLDLARTLAKKYEVSLWQVNMTHLQFLFDSELSTKKIESLINDRNLMFNLSNKPVDFFEAMEKYVLLAIDGKDHERMILYYSLIEYCDGSSDAGKNALAHIKVLKKLKSAAGNLNYKLLLETKTDILSFLQPTLSAANVNALAKVAKSIPASGKSIEPSTVYCAWLHKYYFQTEADKRMKTSSDWIHRYVYEILLLNIS